jgi:hypothetical protein
MVLESAQKAVKRGRGRPKKTQLVEENKTHIEKHKKHMPSASSLSWEDELAAFEKTSNKSWLLTMLILLLGIALIWYGMYLKLHQADRITDDMPVNPTISSETQKSTEQKPEKITTAPSNSIVQDYFSRVNNGQFDTLSQLQDQSFKSLSTLRTYFNTTRLALFAKNTIWWIRVEALTENTTDPAIKRNPAVNPKAYDFVMTYKLKSDEKEYRDAWRVYVVQRLSGSVINWFVYQWTGISQSPFFQFNKFGIK